MQSIREQTENFEVQMLSPLATFSKNSRGRAVFEKPCEIRTEFQRDRDRVLYPKEFRRLICFQFQNVKSSLKNMLFGMMILKCSIEL